MSDVTVDQIDPYDGMDLGAYRYAVARLLRLLIRARLIQEPEFLDPDDRRRWQDDTIQGGDGLREYRDDRPECAPWPDRVPVCEAACEFGLRG